jgi:para-aminobenzoate synthetase component I
MALEIGFETFPFQPYMGGMNTPIVSEIVYGEPFAMARRLKGEPALTLFESAQRHEHLGRYSFLAVRPRHSLVVQNGVAHLDGVPSAVSPFKILREVLTRNRMNVVHGLPPFQGGWAGYISYDYGRHLEPKARITAFAPVCPDMVFHYYAAVIAIDHLEERAWVIGQTAEDVAQIEALLAQKQKPLGPRIEVPFTPTHDVAKYMNDVQKTVDYIRNGDIFQANITQTLTAETPPLFDCFRLYAQLRASNPAPFAALLDYDGIKVVSSSPERLIRFDGRIAEARPIKGTCKRDDDPCTDEKRVAALLSSRKDRAENVMIVDLLRNDLSIVSKPGTVDVPVLCGLETYANVHHLVSVVQGALSDGVDAVDLVKAVFPGGSITGAPKVRAMEIISELEQCSRGVYCGAMGYFGTTGTCDFNIGIRTVQVADGVMRVQGGGGITLRSEPQSEYDESLVKVARILEAMQ